MNTLNNHRLVPASRVWRDRYGISLMSGDRWMNDQNLRFPKPVKIRNRNYFYEDELDAFDARMAELGRRAASAA